MASAARQPILRSRVLGCFVASLLAKAARARTNAEHVFTDGALAV